MRKYETVIIANVNCTLENIDKIMLSLQDLIGKDNIINVDFIGVRELANKLLGNIGYYIVINYNYGGNIITKVENICYKTKDVLKVITVRTE